MSDLAAVEADVAVVTGHLRSVGDSTSRAVVVHALVRAYGLAKEPTHPVRSWELAHLSASFGRFGFAITAAEFDAAIEFAFGGGAPYEWPLS